jgi:hypothetical protein
MGVCSHCGNEYDKTFDVKASDGRTATFDSFECAIAGMAPRCAGCGVPIIGHGVEEGASMYCCRSCAASANGESAIRDRV